MLRGLSPASQNPEVSGGHVSFSKRLEHLSLGAPLLFELARFDGVDAPDLELMRFGCEVNGHEFDEAVCFPYYCPPFVFCGLMNFVRAG